MEYTVKKEKLGYLEKMITLSICLMPYTVLKVVGPLGPAEFLMMAVFFIELQHNSFRISLGETFISKYYIMYLLAAFVGTLYNFSRALVSAQELSAGDSSIVFDLCSYLFNLMALFAFEMRERDDERKCSAECILKRVVDINCVAMPAFFLLSRFQRSIFGMRLLYHEYFTPLATNLHHTSMYLLPLSFASIYIGERSIGKLKRLRYWVCGILFMFFASQTGSTKAGLGAGLGLAICIFYLFTTLKGRINFTAKITFVALMILGTFLFVIFYEAIIQYGLDFFLENDVGNGRQEIWGLALEKWKQSPIFGFGYGSHVKLGEHYWDAHNTLLTVLLQAGIAGMCAYLALWWKIAKHSAFDGYLLAMNASIFIYVAGGDVLRRIPCWSFIMLGYLIVNDNKAEKRTEIY